MSEKDSGGGRFLTVVMQQDGATTSRTFRVRRTTVRLGMIATALLLVAIIAGLVVYLPVVRAAARVPGLEREVARLENDNAKVRELSAAIDSLEHGYAQVRKMLGADIVRDPNTASTLQVAPPVRARIPAAVLPASTPTPRVVPSLWPLDESGYITRGQVGTGERDEVHPGLDVALPGGSMVRASANGMVKQAGEDPEYGLFVLLDHADGYQTMYGHLSRIVVDVGKPVEAGAVIGLSGNTGRSTAPHLHFEVRRGGLSLDPLTLVNEGR